MSLNFADLNWVAILVCVIVGQVLLTLWFTVIFGDPWAKAYGAASRAEHTKAVPPWTYGIGLAGVILVTVGTALLQAVLGVTGLGGGLGLGLFLAVFIVVAAIVPGYAFLRKLDGGVIAAGSQAMLVIVVSAILGAFG